MTMSVVVGAIWNSETGQMCTLRMQDMITTYDPETMMDVVTMGPVEDGAVFTGSDAVAMCCAQSDTNIASVDNGGDLTFPDGVCG